MFSGSIKRDQWHEIDESTESYVKFADFSPCFSHYQIQLKHFVRNPWKSIDLLLIPGLTFTFSESRIETVEKGVKKLTVKKPESYQWLCPCISIFNFEHISYLLLMHLSIDDF